MFEHMKKQFELYAIRDMNYPAFTTSTDEVKQFVGILLVSGYHHLPMKRDCWSTAEDLSCKAVASAMSKNRFNEMKFCHLADNASLSESRVAKVEPL